MKNVWAVAAACSVALLAGGVRAQQAPGGRRQRPSQGAESEMHLVATIKDLMISVVDPSADDLWNAVSTEVTAQGIIEHEPKTAEEWAKAERDALILVEAGNLLKMPGRVIARPEELHGKSTTDPAELTPAQIGERIAKARPAFLQFANMLSTSSTEALKAARAKNAKGLFDAGERIYDACLACHQTFWYPGSFTPGRSSKN